MKNVERIRAELRAELALLRVAERESNRLDELWNTEPENEKMEAEWDAAYRQEHEIFDKCIGLLVKLTGVTRGTAYTMLQTRRDRIEDIVG